MDLHNTPTEIANSFNAQLHPIIGSGSEIAPSLITVAGGEATEINGGGIVHAGGGDNYIHNTNAAADWIYGEGGRDVIVTDGGNDFLYGGEGNDALQSGAGDDALEGNDGDDVLAGGAGADYMLGGDGNDALFGGGGARPTSYHWSVSYGSGLHSSVHLQASSAIYL